jgi:hypothetical protein
MVTNAAAYFIGGQITPLGDRSQGCWLIQDFAQDRI